MKTFCKVFYGGCIAILLGACSTVVHTRGQVIHSDQLEQLRVGITTKEQVSMILGSPSSTSTFEQDVWYYVSERVIDKPLNPGILTERTVLELTFDESNRLSELQERGADDGRTIDPSNRTTRTHGQKPSIAGQLLENFGTGF